MTPPVLTLQAAAADGRLQPEIRAIARQAGMLRAQMLMAGQRATAAIHLIEQGHHAAAAAVIRDIADAAQEVDQ